MTPNRFLQKHVHDLHGLQVDYAFLRNSQGYPEILTGDIDLLVKITDLNEVYQYYKKLRREEIRVVQIIKRRRDLYVMLFFPQGGERKFLVLEYYTGIVFRGQVVVPGERFLKTCDVDGVWRRLSDSVSISYTFFHYILYKGYLPSKYQEAFNKHTLDVGIIAEVFSFIDVAPDSAESKLVLKSPAILRSRILKKISRIGTIFSYARQFAGLRREGLGCALKVNPADTQAVMEFADKFHLYRPAHRYVVKSNRFFSALTAFLIYILGGLAVLPDPKIVRRGSAELYFEEKVASLG